MASILLFTDFGTSGPYLGQVQAVLAEYAPSIPSYLLLADAPMFKPKAAGYLLAGLLPKLPPGSVVLSVVDPGVGTSRRALAMVVDGRWIDWSRQRAARCIGRAWRRRTCMGDRVAPESIERNVPWP